MPRATFAPLTDSGTGAHTDVTQPLRNRCLLCELVARDDALDPNRAPCERLQRTVHHHLTVAGADVA